MPRKKTEDAAAAAVAATAAGLAGDAGGPSLADRARSAIAGAKNPAGAAPTTVNFQVGILGEPQGALDIAGIRKSLDDDLDRLFKATKSAAKGSRSGRVEVLERIREFSAKMTGRTPDQIPNIGLKNVRKGLITVVKQGATRVQVGATAALLLEKHLGGKSFGFQEFKGKGSFAEQVAKRGQRSLAAGGPGRERLTGALAASGEAPGGVRKFLSGRLGKMAGGIAAYFAAELVAGNLRERRENKLGIQRLLREGAGAGTSLVDPNLFLNFLGDQGEGFEQAIQNNPELAVALFDRLQAMAGAKIPTGSAVLRSSQAGVGSADSLISQLQGGQ